MAYQIRYTCSGELQAQIVDFISRNAVKYIIAREVATREHLQCYVEIKITKKTWVNKFNDRFKDMDRRDKYVEPDKGRTKYYVCKDGDILQKRGFTDEDITNYRKEYLESQIPEEIKNLAILPPETIPEKPVKKKKPTFMMEVRLDLEETFPEKDWTSKDRPIVFKFVMRKLGQYCRALDHIIISRMVYGVLNSLVKDKQEWLSHWYQKAFEGNDLSNDEALGKLDEDDIFTDTKYLY